MISFWKGFPWVGFRGCLISKALLAFQQLFLQEHGHPCENKDGMNNCLGFTHHLRKCIKCSCLCSVLPRCWILPLAAPRYWREQWVKSLCSQVLAAQAGAPQAYVTTLTVHNQLEVGQQESRWKEKPFQIRTAWEYRSHQEKKPVHFPLATLAALLPQLHFPPPSFTWCYLHTGFCCPTFVQPPPRHKINALFN